MNCGGRIKGQGEMKILAKELFKLSPRPPDPYNFLVMRQASESS